MFWVDALALLEHGLLLALTLPLICTPSYHAAACHMGGNNSVIPERTLRKEAIQQYLDGGLTLEAIVYQACTGCIMPCAPCGTWRGRVAAGDA